MARIREDVPVFVEQCQFISCWNGIDPNGYGGGAIFTQEVHLKCTSCSFSSCKARSGFGGAICCLNWSLGTITSCRFDDCLNEVSDKGGGAIYGATRRLTLVESNFTRCTCSAGTSTGGAVLACAGIQCDRCEFSNCQSSGNGGAVWASIGSRDDQKPVQVSHSLFDTCVGVNAGGLYVNDGKDDCEVSYCQFISCTGRNAEAASVCINATALEFRNVSVSVRNAGRSFVMLVGSQRYEIIGCEIDGRGGSYFNTETAQCILLPNECSEIVIVDSKFSNFGKDYNSGGAFRFSCKEPEMMVNLTRCHFDNVKVKQSQELHGGALAFFAGTGSFNVIIDQCQFEDCNSETGRAGAVYLGSLLTGVCRIDGTHFTNNRATVDGCGQSLELGESAGLEITIQSCFFEEHEGYVFSLSFGRDKSPVFTDCHFIGSMATKDNGIMLLSGITEVSFDRCSFVRINGKNCLSIPASRSSRVFFRSCDF